MSLLDILKPAPAITGAPAGRVRLISNALPSARVHRIAGPDEDQDVTLADALAPDVPINNAGEGETMPTGHYDRSKAKARKKKAKAGQDAGEQLLHADKPARKTSTKVKAARTPASRARFGVFDDGSVQIATEDCTGRLDADDANALVAFISRLQAK